MGALFGVCNGEVWSFSGVTWSCTYRRGRRLDEIHACAEGRRKVAATRVVEKRARKAEPRRLEHGDQGTAVEGGPQPIFEQVEDPATGDGRLHGEVRRTAESGDERPTWFDVDRFAMALELPHVPRNVRKAPRDAIVVEQVAWMRRRAATREVLGRGRGGVALHARPDRYRHHVVLERFVVADARIEALRDHVDPAFVGDDFDADARYFARNGGTMRGSTSVAAAVGTLSLSRPTG